MTADVILFALSVFIVSANTTFRTLYIQLLSTNVLPVSGYHQVQFTATQMEKNTEVQASLLQLSY